MGIHPRRRRFAGGGNYLSVGAVFAALAVAAALSFVRVAVAGTPGTAGDTTADRELGEVDFTHSMFDFGGADALSGPTGVAVDAAGHLYVGDSINNRVLGWTSASMFNNGAPASIVIGQPDFYSYRCDDGAAGGDVGGMGADSLCGPEGVAVDSAGNLYVADSIDNRVLEFSSPFLSGVTQGEAAAMVFGQHGSFVGSGCDDGIAGADVAGVGVDSLCDPRAVAVDAVGNLYIADSGASRVLEYSTPLNAGIGESGAGDALADMVFGQSNSFTTKLCADGTAGGDVSGTGPDSLCGPTGVITDASGNLYVADTNNNRILEYNTPLNPSSGLAGAGDTIADNVFGQNGSFTTGGANDGAGGGDVAGLGPDSLSDPQGLVTDGAGNLYVADAGNSRLLEFNTPLNSGSGESGAGDAVADLVFGQAGSFTTALCNGSDTGLLAGFGIVVDAGALCSPASVALDAPGNLYATDSDNGRLLVYNTPLNAASGESGAGDTIADRELGQTDLEHNMDNFGGPAALELANPASTNVLAANPAIDADGHLYVADTANSRVLGWTSASAFADGAAAALVIGQPDFFSFVCDAGLAGGDVNGVGPDSLCEPSGVAVDSAGNLYVADADDNRVLEFAQPFSSGMTAGQSAQKVFGQGGSFTTVVSGGGVDGLNRPSGVAVDPEGDVFVADTDNSRVLEYDDPLAAGGGTPGISGSAGDTTADLVFGQNLSFATVACNDGAAGGDLNGAGPDSLCNPTGVALDQTGNLYVADYGNSRVFEYDAGDTNADFVFGQAGSFTATGCNRGIADGDIGGVGPDSLCQPASVAADSAGDLYVTDTGDNRVLEYNTPLNAASGESGAGDASADLVFGRATDTDTQCVVTASADTLCAPNGVALDSAGNLYVADSADSRMLEYDHPQAIATPTPTASPTGTPSPAPTPTQTPVATPTPIVTPTPTPIASPTPSAAPTPTPTASSTATPSPVPTPTPTPIASPTATPSPAPTPIVTPTPVVTPAPTPTPTPTPVPGGTLSVATPMLFGSVGIGVAPRIRVVNIHNLSPYKTLTVSLGAMARPCAVLSGFGPFAIAPLHKTAVTIQFTPTLIGKATGSLNITSSDLHHPVFTVALVGHGVAGTLALPVSMGFGRVGIGVTPGSMRFAVRNSGIGMLTGSVGALAAPFNVSAGGGTFNLAPGQKQFVTVQFTPTVIGHVSATLAIISDDPAHPSVNLPIGGIGVGGHLVVNLAAPIPPAVLPTLGFGPVARSTTLTKTFTVTNAARGVLNGSVGAFAIGSPFTLTQGAAAFTLQPHQSLTIGVQFAPTVTGRATATLVMTDTAPGTPATVKVSVAGRGS